MSQLRIFRNEYFLSQIELTEVTGIPRHRIQLAESGMRVLSNAQIRKIAELFQLDEIPLWLKNLEATDETI